MTQLLEILKFVATAVWQTWPLFLLSIVLSVFIRALKLDGLIRRVFSAHVGTAVLLATLVGAFSPFCSCTVVPVIAGLLLSGVPLAPIMSFWIASPTMDPEIFALSVGILGWPLALTRLAATLGVSLAAGYLTLALTRFGRLTILTTGTAKRQRSTGPDRPRPVGNYSLAMAAAGTTAAAEQTYVTVEPACATEVCQIATSRDDSEASDYSPAAQSPPWFTQLAASFQQLDWKSLGVDVARQSWSLGRWLLLAFVMEAVITTTIPQEAIAGMLGDQNVMAIPLAALIGVPLYLSNISALPIVSGLLAQGMQPGAAIAFLIAGPVTTIPAMTAVYGVVKKQIFVWYLSISLLGAMAMGMVANWVLG